ncbi:HipA domain-containing protein [Corynebacterium sp. AOP40-9SA-29]|uniref:HipA domain-containing protein n=1 Tax=Corynebacterium sp. AOP40-9SA-29 TaxID=3457677 RepID=UPI004034305D
MYLSGVLAGRIRRATGGLAAPALTYTDEWLNTAGSYPLSLSLPMQPGQGHPERTVRFLESLIPENRQTLNDWHRRHRKMDPNDPTSVLAFVGEDVAGAARFVPAGQLPEEHRDSVVLSDREVGDMLADLRENHGAMPFTMEFPKVSLAGQQPKIGLYRDEHGWRLPFGDLPSAHILKPAAEGLTALDINEAAMLQAAAALGIPTAQSAVEVIGGEQVFVTQRYDRVRDDTGRVQRLHQEDFAQAMGYAAAAKYQKTGGPGMREIVAFLKANVTDPDADPDADLDVFNRLLAFNVAIGNADAHAKNHSVIITPVGSRLAPAYDLLSVVPYPQFDQELAFKVGKHYRPSQVTAKDWEFYATKTDQNVDRVLAVVADTWARVPDAAADALRACNAPVEMRDMILAAAAAKTLRT